MRTWPPVLPLGMIVIFWTLSECGSLRPIIAWPDSWKAILRFSSWVIVLLDLAGPAIDLSIASSISAMMIFSLLALTAKIAASFKMLAKSAPEKPTVRWAIAPKSTAESIILLRAWTFKIASLPSLSGRSTVICLSNLPALNKAGSRTSALFVAAITITPELSSKPSISTKSWLRVCSLSSLPPPKPAPLCLPTASISSMKIKHGAFCLATLNMSLTLPAPTPTYISTKSEPEME